MVDNHESLMVFSEAFLIVVIPLYLANCRSQKVLHNFWNLCLGGWIFRTLVILWSDWACSNFG